MPQAAQCMFQRAARAAAQFEIPAGTQTGFHPVERELVFDIDLTDYDDVRTCGDGGHICSRCWPLMALAIKVSGWGLWEVEHAQRSRHCQTNCWWLTPFGEHAPLTAVEQS